MALINKTNVVAGNVIRAQDVLNIVNALDGTSATTTVIATGSFTGSLTGSVEGTSSWAISTSFAITASHALNSAIDYVSESVAYTLKEIEIADYSDSVAVTYVGNRLKFIFGTPASQSISSFSFNSTFDTDRFNKVLDSYTATGIWSNGGYTLISASIYEGSELIANTGTGTSLFYAASTSGSRTYTLHITASNPLDSSILVKSASLSGTLSKVSPGNPTIPNTPAVQLGASSNQIEQGATGSIAFSSASGASNGWTFLTLTSNPVGPTLQVTGSATGSTSIILRATASYESPLGDNDPQLNISTYASTTFTKIRSVRYGASALTSITEAQLNDLAFWDTTLGGTIGTIAKGTVNPNNYQFTINTTAQYIYIVIDSSYTLAGILNVNNSNANDLPGAFGGGPIATIGNYKVYRSNGLSTTSILYKLTT